MKYLSLQSICQELKIKSPSLAKNVYMPRAIRRLDLSPCERLIFEELVDRYNLKTTRCDVSIRRMSKELRMSKSHIADVIIPALEGKYIFVERRPKRRNKYSINWTILKNKSSWEQKKNQNCTAERGSLNPEEENHLDVEENRPNCTSERDTDCTSNRTLTREDKNNRVGASAYAPAPALKRRINPVQAKLEALSELEEALEEENSCPVVRTECDKPTLVDSVSSTEVGSAPAVEPNCDKPTLVDSFSPTKEDVSPGAVMVPPPPAPPPAHEPTSSNHDWDILTEKLSGLLSSRIVSPRRPAADDELPTKEITLPMIDGPEGYAVEISPLPYLENITASENGDTN